MRLISTQSLSVGQRWRGGSALITVSVRLVFLEAEWTEWFDRDDERGSGDWEKLTDLHKAFPERLCSNPLDIEVKTWV